ncbi:MAG: Na+/H+ antiporter subunit E [Cellulomonadaceae bacterium]|jgi:multicomponent Na+:H+ antiporter subunit E|nr:Na+/H+ antiporter subunit E [Cellulomonadaceae bacterium]
MKRRWLSLKQRWLAVVFLIVVWMALWGNIHLGTIISGVVVAVGITMVFPQPQVDRRVVIHLGFVVRLVARFLVDLVRASFNVAWLAFKPGPMPHSALVGVQLRPAPEQYFAMTAGLTSLVPGAVVVEADAENSAMLLHVMDIEGSGGALGVRRDTLALEARVLDAFASNNDMAITVLAALEEEDQ